MRSLAAAAAAAAGAARLCAAGCPGGSTTACMQLCPTSPAPAFKACVATCADDCGDAPAPPAPATPAPPAPPTPPPAPPPAPRTCTSSDGQNSAGANLREIDGTGGAGGCCDACLAAAGCAGWTYVKGSGECWLKSTISGLTPDPAVVSGEPDGPPPSPTPAPPPTPAPTRPPIAPVVPPPGAAGAGWGAAGQGGGALGGEHSARLLGKTLRFAVDVSQAGCGRVTGVYLVQNGTRAGECDASGSFGRCGEIDIVEGNKYSWHSTLHDTWDHPGNFGGFGGVQQPDMMYGRGPRDMTGEQYGPGAKIIDTTREFHAAVSFPEDGNGRLVDMIVMLHQDGKDDAIEWRVNKARGDPARTPPLTCDDGGCPNCFSKPGCVYQQDELRVFGGWLTAGMTPLSTYWGGQQTWLDATLDDEAGWCKLGTKGTPGTENLGTYANGGGAEGSYRMDGFTLEDIHYPSASWEDVFRRMDENPVFPQNVPRR